MKVHENAAFIAEEHVTIFAVMKAICTTNCTTGGFVVIVAAGENMTTKLQAFSWKFCLF